MFASFGLIPIFSTKTFPNFYSIATGLYQESHGIVDNRFYDPKWNATFSIHDPVTRSESRWFEQGEPIWKTAILQGKRVGTFFWPGSDIAHQGVRPTFWRAYDSSIKFKERVDTVVGWLRNEQLDMAMMYVNEPDHVAHLTGPFSEQTKQKIEQLDQMIGYMLGKLKTYGLMDSVDILILSDHGMSGPAELNNRIALSDYIYLKGNIKSVPTTGSVVHIEPMPGKENEVYRRLNNAHPHMKVYRKKDLPDRWHFKNNSRIMPIVAVADEGYVISKVRK